MSFQERVKGEFRNIEAGNVTELGKLILLKSITPDMWILHLTLPVIGMLLGAAVVGLGLLVTLALVLLQPLLLRSPLIIFVLALFWLLCALLLIVALSALQGIKVNAVNDFIQNGKFSFTDSWNKTRPRLLTIVGVKLVFMLAVLLLVGLILVPFILVFVLSDTGIVPVYIFLGIFVWMGVIMLGMLLSFFLTPFLLILEPVIVLGDASVFGSIQRTISLGKNNYVYNFIFYLFYLAFSYVISFVYQILLFIPMMVLVFFPLAGMVVMFVLMVPLSMYFLVLDSLLGVGLYRENLRREGFNSSRTRIRPRAKPDF